MISFPRKLFGSRFAPWGLLLLAVVAAAALRYAAMDRLAPREFSYFIESCFRFRYAEMRMLGEEPPALDRPGQWPEGFAVDRMILSTPDRLAAAFYRLRGGDTFFASRDLINVLSAGSVVVFTALALALFRRPGPAAAAVVVYGVTFGAFSRSWGNYLREDFAMPGLLAATAAAVYLVTAERVRRPALLSLGAAAAAFWAGSCWHMSQFYLAVLALFVVAYGVAGRASRAAWAGGGLWVGLTAAAVLNQPLWAKGALWNVSAALTLAPAAASLVARILRQPHRARWFLAGGAALLVALSLAFGRSAGYGHVYELVWAKLLHLGRYPGPAALSPEARLFWVGPYQSPEAMRFLVEYGLLVPASLIGFVLAARQVRRRAGGEFVVAAALFFAALYLLIARLTIFLAPWVAIAAAYPFAAVKRLRLRLAYGLALALLAAGHYYVTLTHDRPSWYREPLMALTHYEPAFPWYYGSERVDLLVRLVAEGEPKPVLADFALSPPFLYLAGQPTALNPMFEVPAVRRKALAYAEAALGTEEDFYWQCEAWEVAYVVHFAPQVLSRGTGSFYNATAREPGPESAAYLLQFHPERLRRFRLVFETYSTRLFEVGRPYDGYRSPAYHPLFDGDRFASLPAETELEEFYRESRRAQYYYEVGCAQQERENFVAAAAAFSQVLRLHPDFEEAELRLGFCQLRLGQYEEARRALDRAALTRPHDRRAKRYLALLESFESARE
ncbi:MAG: tetratricopeptide repeat protein [Candidatus Coatesbacteria bacterium]|nr:MAG: tetratricopeptide repeat protein [Candidatus Coatesbacteria bacterium]